MFINELEKLLRQEIHKIPRPFGIFLSGGLDSGLLAALSKPNFALHCTFQLGEKYDESWYAQKIASYLKIPLTIIKPQQETFKDELVKGIKIIGKVINSVSIVPWYNAMKWAKGKTMILGEGGDELFGGYARYLILKHIFELYGKPELQNYCPMLDSAFKGLHSKLVGIELPDSKNIQEVMDIEYSQTLPDIIYMENKLAEYFGVKLYRPFMSKNIREFANKLPMEFKIKNSTTKWIVRKLAKKYLPKEIIERKQKMGFVAPINLWMGWMDKGEFNKEKYLAFQNEIINNSNSI